MDTWYASHASAWNAAGATVARSRLWSWAFWGAVVLSAVLLALT